MKEKKLLFTGIIFVLGFIILTLLLKIIDVQPVGLNGTYIGFATLNCLFHNFTGVNMLIYYITDWLGLIPIFCCIFFCVFGFVQLIKRRNLFKVDYDILLLGIYYSAVIFGYMFFEMMPINYRPVLIDGILEPSYPSSTTLLTLSVMATVIFQAKRRIENLVIKKIITTFSVLFSLIMTTGRAIAGVHWLTDIIGSIILSYGLYMIYKSSILLFDKIQNK